VDDIDVTVTNEQKFVELLHNIICYVGRSIVTIEGNSLETLIGDFIHDTVIDVVDSSGTVLRTVPTKAVMESLRVVKWSLSTE
jgi:hypothetical protein